MKLNVKRAVLRLYLMVLLMAMPSATLAKGTNTKAKDIITLDDVTSKGSQETAASTSLHRLSRKRRYLQFPEGSSFQLVYDLVIGVVDYANYITVSITMALAYALPSKPPSELLEELKDNLEDDTFIINRNDTASDFKYVDADRELKKPSANIQKNLWYPHKTIINEHNETLAANRDYYNTLNFNPFNNYLSKNSEYMGQISNTGNDQFLRSGFRPKTPNFRHVNRNSVPIRIPSLLRNVPKEHRIYPILGKRIASNAIGRTNGFHHRSGIANYMPSKYDRIHIRHQRNTRHSLYNAIETYLDRKNLNGHQCILRALCETGRKSEELQPGSFIGELMRALFTMPEPLEGNERPDYKEEIYDRAHALHGDCADRYHECGHSLWSSHFV